MIKINLSSLLSQSLLIISGFSGWSLLDGGITVAQTSPLLISELPPPPSLTQMNDEFSSEQGEAIETIPSFESPGNTPDSQVVPQEYNFQAPQQNYYSAPASPVDKLVEFYRVEVIAQEVIEEQESLLSQVKRIEPFAYSQLNQGQKVIYAGLFQDQQEAQQRVQELTNQGLSARIVPVSYSVSSSYDIRVQQ